MLAIIRLRQTRVMISSSSSPSSPSWTSKVLVVLGPLGLGRWPEPVCVAGLQLVCSGTACPYWVSLATKDKTSTLRRNVQTDHLPSSIFPQ